MTGAGGALVAFFRPAGEGAKLEAALAARNLRPLHLPLIAFEPGPDLSRLEELLSARDGWLLVTSPRGAASVVGCRIGKPSKTLRIAAVGAATKAVLEAAGLEVALQGRGGAAGLLEVLPARLDGVSVVWPTGDRSAPRLEEGVRERGGHMHRLEVYRTRLLRLDSEAQQCLSAARALLFTSPSIVQALKDSLGEDFPAFLDARVVGVLGQLTKDAVLGFGPRPLVEATTPRLDALVAAVADALSGS